MSNDVKKFSDLKPEIDRLHNQTKTTLHEINIELLRNKEELDDRIKTIQSSLEELLNW